MTDGDGGQVVVITGASAGVGRATVRGFAKRGARIGLIARGRTGLEAARREVEELGGRALVLQLDVADADAVEAAAERVEQELGPIDVWVNDAMASVFSPVKEMTAEEFRRVTEVTYLGYVYGTLSALRRMLPRDRGVIVQVGSALAYRGIPLQSAYCAAKHAIQGFCDSLRTELIHDGSRVQVTMVQMPALNTPQFGWVKSRLPREGAAGAPHLPAGSGGGRDPLRRGPSAPRDVGRLADGQGDRGQQDPPRLRRPLPRQSRLSSRSRPASPWTRTGGTTCGSRWTTSATTAHTANSTTGRWSTAGSCG